MKRWIQKQGKILRQDWLRLCIVSVVASLVVIVIAQFFYPSSRLVPFTVIDNVKLGGELKDDAVKQLDQAYDEQTIPIYFGIALKPYRSPHPSDIGLTISNTSRIKEISYPWYLRLVPTSIFWVQDLPAAQPSYRRNDTILASYVSKELGDSCNVKPENASLKVVNNTFVVIPGQSGGTCSVATVKQLLSRVTPRPGANNHVTIPVQVTMPSVSDTTAKDLGDHLRAKIGTGISVQAGNDAKQIPAKEILSWLDFSTASGRLEYTFSSTRAADYLNTTFGASVAVQPGTTTVNTMDFVETGRSTGPSGAALDVAGTLANLKAYIDGTKAQAVAATTPVPPTITYNRSYSPTNTGLSALMQHYADSHTGTYGVAMVELSGQHRNASYNSTQSFTTASTYKLFVAYSTLKRVENGSFQWSDEIDSGRDLTTCFNDMIEKSDNACAVALLHKIGQKAVTDDAHSLGCNDTSFVTGDNIISTPADEALFLSELVSNQMLSQQTSRDRFINALKQNVYRQGIPAGIQDATVADKVGFLWALLHDAAIVYSPTGTYVLVIMTDGSTWGNIAELAGQIEALRNQ